MFYTVSHFLVRFPQIILVSIWLNLNYLILTVSVQNMQLFITALLVVSAFAEEKSEDKQSDKKQAKRGIFGLGYGGYGGYTGYSSSIGYGAHGSSSFGYSGLGHAGYVASSPVAATYVQPHTHTHSVETKLVAQVRINEISTKHSNKKNIIMFPLSFAAISCC